jgi:peptidyl-prolyl cis-trans isomerase SurA
MDNMHLPQASVRALRVAFGIAACLTLVAGCGRNGSQSTTSSAGPDVWATVDGRDIHRDEVEKAYRGAVDPNAQPADEEVQAAKLSVLDELINQDILLAKAKAAGLEATDAEVEGAFADRKRGISDADFNQQLTQRGFTVDDVKRGIRRELTMQKVIDKEVMSRISVGDTDIAAFYNSHRAQFNLAEPQYHLAQIVVTPQRDPQLVNRMKDDAGTPAEAKAKLDMLMGKLQSGGEFASLAADYSEDPQSVGNSGDLGLVPQSALDRVPPQLKQLVLKMTPGSANVVTIGANYAIVMLVEKAPAGQRDLNNPEVRDGIRDMLRQQRERLLRAAFMTTIRNDAKVVNHLARQVMSAPVQAPALVTPAAPAAPAAPAK